MKNGNPGTSENRLLCNGPVLLVYFREMSMFKHATDCSEISYVNFMGG